MRHTLFASLCLGFTACELFGLGGLRAWEGEWKWTAGSNKITCGAMAPSTQGPNQETTTIHIDDEDEGILSVSSQTPSCFDLFKVAGDVASVRASSTCRSISPYTWTKNTLTLSADKSTLTWVRDGTYAATTGTDSCRIEGTTTLSRVAGTGPSDSGLLDAGSSSGGTLRATFSNLDGGPQTQADTFETTFVRCSCFGNCSDWRVDAEENPSGFNGRTVIARMKNGPPVVGTAYAMGTSFDHPATAQFIDRRTFAGSSAIRLWDTRSLYVTPPRGTLIFDSFNLAAGTATFRVVGAVMARTESPTTGTFHMDVTGTCSRIDL